MSILNSNNPSPNHDFQSGAVLLVDKPKSWTSFDVVNKIRYRLKHRLGVKKIKVGHAGTLDPLATGLLIICIGKMTKQIEHYQGLSKEYSGIIELGATTPSYDAETEPDQKYPTSHIDLELIEKARDMFIGQIEQIPPMFSAIKVDGQPLYKKARKGIKMDLKPRPVTIEKFEFTNIDPPKLHFLVTCSKGTYIRSLAHDFGKAVRSGAYLTALKRTRIGDFQLTDAWKLDDLITYLESEPISSK